MTEDRRTRRTRRNLSDALVVLVLERGFSSLTVEDITERADVGRATFYSHFRDREDLFARVTADLLEELTERLAPVVSDSYVGFTGKPVLEMLRHARERRDVYRIVLRGEGDGKPLQTFTDTLARATADEFRDRADRNEVTPGSIPTCSPVSGSENRSPYCGGGRNRRNHPCRSRKWYGCSSTWDSTVATGPPASTRRPDHGATPPDSRQSDV